MGKQIYIRVEGNKRVGLGHFIRCKALIEMLNSYFEVTLVGKEVPEKLVKEKNIQFLKIREEEDFWKVLDEEKIVVVDGYDFDETYFKFLKEKKATVVSVQDIYHYSRNIDLVINHLPGSERFYSDVELLSGPRYAILRQKFLELPTKKASNSEEIFISLGGTENYSLVNNIVEILNQNMREYKINVLTTDGNKAKIKGKNLVLFSNMGEDAIIEIIDRSSICLITSGMISYEVLARNKKAIVGALNEGQDTVGQYFKEMELVEYLGYWKDLTQEVFSEALLMQNIDHEKVASVFDGGSGERIRNKFLSL